MVSLVIHRFSALRAIGATVCVGGAAAAAGGARGGRVVIFEYENSLDFTRTIHSYDVESLGMSDGEGLSLELCEYGDGLHLLVWKYLSTSFAIINIDSMCLRKGVAPEAIQDCRFSSVFGLAGVPIPVFLFKKSFSFQNADLCWNIKHNVGVDADIYPHMFIGEDEYISFNNGTGFKVYNFRNCESPPSPSSRPTMKEMMPPPVIKAVRTLNGDLLIQTRSSIYLNDKHLYQFSSVELGNNVFIFNTGVIITIKDDGNAFIFSIKNEKKWQKLEFQHSFYPPLKVVDVAISKDGFIYAKFIDDTNGSFLISEQQVCLGHQETPKDREKNTCKTVKRILRSFPMAKDPSLVLFHLNNYLKECHNLEIDSDLKDMLMFFRNRCKEKMLLLEEGSALIELFEKSINDIDDVLDCNRPHNSPKVSLPFKRYHKQCHNCSYIPPPSQEQKIIQKCYCGVPFK